MIFIEPEEVLQKNKLFYRQIRKSAGRETGEKSEKDRKDEQKARATLAEILLEKEPHALPAPLNVDGPLQSLADAFNAEVYSQIKDKTVLVLGDSIEEGKRNEAEIIPDPHSNPGIYNAYKLFFQLSLYSSEINSMLKNTRQGIERLKSSLNKGSECLAELIEKEGETEVSIASKAGKRKVTAKIEALNKELLELRGDKIQIQRKIRHDFYDIEGLYRQERGIEKIKQDVESYFCNALAKCAESAGLSMLKETAEAVAENREYAGILPNEAIELFDPEEQFEKATKHNLEYFIETKPEINWGRILKIGGAIVGAASVAGGIGIYSHFSGDEAEVAGSLDLENLSPPQIAPKFGRGDNNRYKPTTNRPKPNAPRKIPFTGKMPEMTKAFEGERGKRLFSFTKADNHLLHFGGLCYSKRRYFESGGNLQLILLPAVEPLPPNQSGIAMHINEKERIIQPVVSPGTKGDFLIFAVYTPSDVTDIGSSREIVDQFAAAGKMVIDQYRVFIEDREGVPFIGGVYVKGKGKSEEVPTVEFSRAVTEDEGGLEVASSLFGKKALIQYDNFSKIELTSLDTEKIIISHRKAGAPESGGTVPLELRIAQHEGDPGPQINPIIPQDFDAGNYFFFTIVEDYAGNQSHLRHHAIIIDGEDGLPYTYFRRFKDKVAHVEDVHMEFLKGEPNPLMVLVGGDFLSSVKLSYRSKYVQTGAWQSMQMKYTDGSINTRIPAFPDHTPNGVYNIKREATVNGKPVSNLFQAELKGGKAIYCNYVRKYKQK